MFFKGNKPVPGQFESPMRMQPYSIHVTATTKTGLKYSKLHAVPPFPKQVHPVPPPPSTRPTHLFDQYDTVTPLWFKRHTLNTKTKITCASPSRGIQRSHWLIQRMGSDEGRPLNASRESKNSCGICTQPAKNEGLTLLEDYQVYGI